MLRKLFYPFLFIFAFLFCILTTLIIDKYYKSEFGFSLFDKKDPLISVVITSYNYDKYISKTIESVLNQSYKNIELIIVDDGSTDLSREIIQNYAKKHKNIHFYTHEGNVNKGFIETMKLGIKKSKGKYIAFCESDDFWDRDNLKEKVKLLNKYKDAVIVSNNIFVFGDKLPVIERQKYIDYVDSLFVKERNKINITETSTFCQYQHYLLL